mmetsp:Transcript_24455/g.42831  ORF Transcript_24455/g.42831 Transcript_24455/m.42831 type:complete len:485 (+) Transcript_24455:165-1619(+)
MNSITRESQQQQSSQHDQPTNQNQQQGQQNQNQPQQQQQPNSMSSSTAAAALTTPPTTISTGRRIMQHIHPKNQSSAWLATELLKRTDLSSGDICMFHYPMDFFPRMDMDDMERAFDMIFEGGDVLFARDDNGTAAGGGQAQELQQEDQAASSQYNNNADNNGVPAIPEYMSNASLEARNQVIRIQFSWYQFAEFPRDVLGRTYPNLQHLDIRQNASLTCIDSLISQLPHLTSLNLSDCPNIHTLAPLATTLGMPQQQREGTLQENQLNPTTRRTLSLRHLWVRGCNLSSMSREEWSNVFDTLSESTGPLERLTLSRNNMSYLHGNIGKLKRLTYLFVEDNDVTGGSMNNATPRRGSRNSGFELPDELGNLSNLRFISLCGNNVTSLPRTVGRLHDSCDVYLHRNPNLTYPPPMYLRSITTMRQFFHRERMALLSGAVLFMPHWKRARRRANERLYRPGGWGYMVCKERFEDSARRSSISLMGD